MINEIDIVDFFKQLPQPSPIIWDVRDEKAYTEAHVAGAVNYPLNCIDLNLINTVTDNQPIYVLCGGGTKAPKAAQLINELKPTQSVTILKGGTRAAKTHHLPVVYGL